jgi:hypothetical protein
MSPIVIDSVQHLQLVNNAKKLRNLSTKIINEVFPLSEVDALVRNLPSRMLPSQRESR